MFVCHDSDRRSYRSTQFIAGVVCGILVAHWLNAGNEHSFWTRFSVPRSDKLLCWVVTHPNNSLRAHQVKETWGRRCDTLLFISSQPDDSLPAVSLPVANESRFSLWEKAVLTLRYVHRHHLDGHDWFFKADDDTYALVDNMRLYLATLDPSKALFLGHEFPYGHPDSPTASYLSGGAGYVLSKETLRRLVEVGLADDVCPYRSYTGEEDDVTITVCLKKLGAEVPDTRDEHNNHRFLSCNVEQCMRGQVGPYNCQATDQKRNCLSDRPLTFHYVKGHQMSAYEYLLYRARVADSSPAQSPRNDG